MLDILIKGGSIVDGTGSSAYVSDIGIKDGKIVEIKRNINSPADEIIDASGLMVSPGFIDVHSHNDLVPFMEERLKGLKLLQGVTTELVGQCGLGIVPCVEREGTLWKNYVRGVVGDHGEEWDFEDIDGYLSHISSKGLKNNFAALISHGAIKASVMGFDSGEPDQEQITDMCKIAEDAMKMGAFGMSIGLQYMPAVFSTRKELVAICSVIKKYDGIIMVHLRNHDSTILNAMDEIVSIAEITGIKLHISHLKSYNSEDMGCNADKLINYVDKAVERGIRITFDEHLYSAGSTLLTQILPPWITAGGYDSMFKNLKDKHMILKLKGELSDRSIRYKGWDNYSAVIGWDGVLLTSLKKEENLKYMGRTVGDIAGELGVHPVDFVADLLVDEEGGVNMVTLNVFSEEDIIKLIKHPLQMVGSDSIPAGVPHPRLYGNYPLFIGKFAREKKVLRVEEAVYKSTGLPAKTLGLRDIGELSVGKNADITVFDFNEITGYEEYTNPSKAPKGIRHVILNGRMAVKEGVVEKGHSGRVIQSENLIDN